MRGKIEIDSLQVGLPPSFFSGGPFFRKKIPPQAGVRVVCEWCAGCAYEAVAVGGGGPPGESTGKSILTGSALLSASTGG